MLKSILSFAQHIAKGSGELLLKGFRSEETVVSYKSRTNLVTSVDRASEEYLVAMIEKEYPGHAVLAEEGHTRDTDGEFIWYVDPLDATNNFAHGIPFFCVSLGVFSRVTGSVSVGVVYDPFHDEMFHAVRGEGAFLNGKKISVSSIDDSGIAVLATGFPYDKENPEINNIKQFSHILPHIQGIRRIGSAALDLCYLACGRMDGYWEPGLFPWDMAAGSLIVEEAGGTVTRYDGSRFDPECPEIVASNGKIHKSIIQFLSDVS